MMSPNESNNIINSSDAKSETLYNSIDSSISFTNAHPISSRSSVFCIEHLLNSSKHVNTIESSNDSSLHSPRKGNAPIALI